jgi:hypothetical protein
MRSFRETADNTRGITLTARADPAGKGPAHIILSDPDGNVIMLDQHV